MKASRDESDRSFGGATSSKPTHLASRHTQPIRASDRLQITIDDSGITKADVAT